MKRSFSSRRDKIDQVSGLVYHSGMTVVNVQEAKTQLSRLLTLVEAGDEVVIMRRGKQVARLVRAGQPLPERQPGSWRNSLRIADDFDDELSEDWLEPLEP